MNKLQSLEFDMLKEFVRICDDLGLKYYLVCGSALGAAKYGGFIPWDDDVDVALPRPDYDVFCQKAQSMLPDHLFLQNYKTDPGYPLYMSKIRDSRTTFIEPLYRKIKMHHGVYIDVFPLDGHPLAESEKIKFEKRKILYDRHRMVKYCYNRFSKENIRHLKAIAAYLLYKIFGFWKDTSKVNADFHSYVSSFWCEDSKLWCNYGNWQGHLEYAPKEQYGEGTFVDFEGLKVRIPERYDEYLTQKYGDWRADLPVEKQFNPHHVTVSDLDKPYTEYV